AAEYCRLFILPGGVSPFANVWLGKNPQDEVEALAVRIVELSARLGLEKPDPRQPPTHVGWLLALAALAEQAGPEAQLERTVLDEELLQPWVPRFCRALEKNAREPLYRALGALLRQLISED
ncbi:MAG: molecular chaperone TorD family protein, partial [Acidobacteriota bacterium]